MRIAALDYGLKRIGVAITDESGKFAAPFTTIKNESTIKKISNIVAENSVEKLVVGIPTDSMGRDTQQSKRIRKFYDKLKSALEIEVVLYDENYSTRDAYDELKKLGYSMKKSKQVVDEMAATLILKEYIRCIQDPNS
ncbi:MAG: Holliday junction resolvase RuvX [Candidatus Muiribacterium halophilum]|uniref:Putative pre-16S rRNA nuclease n=1 Tax=Muiribacterium halophilum TaxID=2053465 RepID=A0A2N5ZB72_MUIH1|nr:MAG: Holliday junction resolvase RuvX [Candidatus Muirbacterium halophilum]